MRYYVPFFLMNRQGVHAKLPLSQRKKENQIKREPFFIESMKAFVSFFRYKPSFYLCHPEEAGTLEKRNITASFGYLSCSNKASGPTLTQLAFRVSVQVGQLIEIKKFFAVSVISFRFLSSSWPLVHFVLSVCQLVEIEQFQLVAPTPESRSWKVLINQKGLSRVKLSSIRHIQGKQFGCRYSGARFE